MFLAFTFFATMMTQLGELAAVVEKDISSDRSEFCVTGTVSYVLVYHGRLCHILVEDGDVGVDVIGSFESCTPPLPTPGDILRLDGHTVRMGPYSVGPRFRSLEILGHGDAPRPRQGPSSLSACTGGCCASLRSAAC